MRFGRSTGSCQEKNSSNSRAGKFLESDSRQFCERNGISLLVRSHEVPRTAEVCTATQHSYTASHIHDVRWSEWEGPSPCSYSGSSRVEGSLVSCPIILPVGTQVRRICTREPRTMSWWSDSDMIGSPSFLHCNSTSLRLTHVPFECANRGRTLRGIMANHSGLCLTVFSASNYCGSVGAMVATGCSCNWTAGIWCTLPFFSAEPQAIAEVFSCCDRQWEGSFPTVIVVRLLIGAAVFRNNQQVTSRKGDQRY